jgi:hypothetical protein
MPLLRARGAAVETDGSGTASIVLAGVSLLAMPRTLSSPQSGIALPAASPVVIAASTKGPIR